MRRMRVACRRASTLRGGAPPIAPGNRIVPQSDRSATPEIPRHRRGDPLLATRRIDVHKGTRGCITKSYDSARTTRPYRFAEQKMRQVRTPLVAATRCRALLHTGTRRLPGDASFENLMPAANAAGLSTGSGVWIESSSDCVMDVSSSLTSNRIGMFKWAATRPAKCRSSSGISRRTPT